MKLSIKNIGKIADATIELNGITVIAGENDTGKSTLGKVLFCVFNSFNNISNQIQNERISRIERAIESLEYSFDNEIELSDDANNMANRLFANKEEYTSNPQKMRSELKNVLVIQSNLIDEIELSNLVEEVADRIISLLDISDDMILRTVLQNRLDSEFYGQTSNVFSPTSKSSIELTIKNKPVVITLENSKILSVSDSFSLNTEAIYIDDPFVLDDLSSSMVFFQRTQSTHRFNLKRNLRKLSQGQGPKDVLDEILVSKKLNNIYEKLNTVCAGELIMQKNSAFVYKNGNADTPININNISTGLKTFVIIKTLLMNGLLEEKGTLILDEPEIHLHPEWQLLFAEIIVLIQKEFGMHILLNTHSPYFLNAIEVYSAKYSIGNKCKYYLSENMGTNSFLTDVTDNTEAIYKKLASPLQKLENLRWQDDKC